MNMQHTRRAAGAALAFLTLTACVPPSPAVATAPFAAPSAADARDAGMRALDSLAAAWGGMAIPGAPCDARYEVEALRARCADLAKDAEALRAGLAPLMALASATRGDALAEADERWLTAVDAVFAATAGRGLPEARAAGAAVAAADARLRALLARAAPGYGATGLEELMNPAGAPLSPEEAAALAPLVAEAERALAAWERVAAPAPAGAALAEYSAYLDARADAATGDE